MAKYKITDPVSGKTITISGASAPNQQDAELLFQQAGLRDTPETKTEFDPFQLKATGDLMGKITDFAIPWVKEFPQKYINASNEVAQTAQENYQKTKDLPLGQKVLGAIPPALKGATKIMSTQIPPAVELASYTPAAANLVGKVFSAVAKPIVKVGGKFIGKVADETYKLSQAIPGVSTVTNLAVTAGQGVKDYLLTSGERMANTFLGLTKKGAEYSELRRRGINIGDNLVKDLKDAVVTGDSPQAIYDSIVNKLTEIGSTLADEVKKNKTPLNLSDFKKTPIYKETIAKLKSLGGDAVEKYNAKLGEFTAANRKGDLFTAQNLKEALDDILFPNDRIKERTATLAQQELMAVSDMASHLREKLRAAIGQELYDQYEKFSFYKRLMEKTFTPKTMPKITLETIARLKIFDLTTPNLLLKEMQKPQNIFQQFLPSVPPYLKSAGAVGTGRVVNEQLPQ